MRPCLSSAVKVQVHLIESFVFIPCYDFQEILDVVDQDLQICSDNIIFYQADDLTTSDFKGCKVTQLNLCRCGPSRLSHILSFLV